MVEKICFMLILVLSCSGCETLPEKQDQPAEPVVVSSSGSEAATPAEPAESSPVPEVTTAPAALEQAAPEQKEPPRPVPFAPTYTSSEEDPYSDALEIYESSPKASQGVYKYNGLVFVIVCIDTNKEEIRYLEGTAMLRTVVLLRERYPGLPPKFRIRNRVVEKDLDDDTGIYRYATACRESDILQKLKK